MPTEKLVCYRQPDKQRSFDVARTRGGTQAMSAPQRSRIYNRQKAWAQECTAPAAERGRVMKESWPSLRRGPNGMAVVVAEAASVVSNNVATATVRCAEVMGRRQQGGAAPERSLFTDTATGRTFFTKADLLAFRAQQNRAPAFSPTKAFSACPGQIYVRIQGKFATQETKRC